MSEFPIFKEVKKIDKDLAMEIEDDIREMLEEKYPSTEIRSIGLLYRLSIEIGYKEDKQDV